MGELPISKIKINPSTINIEKVEEYKEIIKINPDYSPLIYDSINNRIIDGAHRTEALKEMGYETVRAYISIPNENETENMPLKFPFDLQVKIKKNNQLLISQITDKINDARELVTTHDVLTKRGWKIQYEL